MPPRQLALARDPQLHSYVSLLRFGTTERFHNNKPLLSYRAIAKIAGIKEHIVPYVLRLYRAKPTETLSLVPKRRLRLRKHHIDYLISRQTLNEWAHLSLKQRAKMFHRQFPESKLSTTSLRRLYKKHGIRFKYIQKIKKEVDLHNQVYRVLFEKMTELLQQAETDKMPVVFLDEAVFTFNTFSKKAWSGPNESITVRDHALKVKTQAFIAAITLEQGLISYSIIPKSIKTEEFKAFLYQLSDYFEGKPFAVFLDNLSVHKTNLSKDVFSELKIIPIFNIPYSPQFNGIESYFSLLKGEYKKLMMQVVMKGERADSVELINLAVKMVDNEKTKKCVKYGFDCI